MIQPEALVSRGKTSTKMTTGTRRRRAIDSACARMILKHRRSGANMSDDMGMLRVDVEVANHTRPGDRRLLHSVIVDTGAELSWVPAHVLEDLGISRVKPIRFRQAGGTALERWVGFAILHAAGAVTTDEIVFGAPGDLVLLGARTLQGMNLTVDLVEKRLVAGGPMLAAMARQESGALVMTRKRKAA